MIRKSVSRERPRARRSFDMATIEIMNQKADTAIIQQRVFNIEGTVGRGGENRQADVMLIQTIFKALEHEEPAFVSMKVPEPTGTIDQSTLRAIWEFQSLSRLTVLKVDGIIHPMQLLGRTLRIAADRQTVLQMLNRNLWFAAKSYNGVDFTLWLMDKFPSLRRHVRDISRLPQI
jgi:hypothetical protein